ncbi:MAG: SagB family peptide dehydrogenase [Actinomycetota bacterium]|nr:SagB family peptide dehydrogenase [Actinomycetota bacterium]
MSQDVISLYKPDIELLEQTDPSFTSVLEKRKSIRSYGTPIGGKELGEFLYRVGRVRAVARPDPERGLFYEISSRPYPSGGAAYELEIYLTINTCPPIQPGIYHYNPLAHELCRISGKRYQAETLLKDAWAAAGKRVVPQVLITLTSRFQRLSWKYSAIAYATTLKNVGVLFQTMYLAATAMGLAPCALGGGNSDLFTEAVGLDHLEESPVGEFMLGTSPDQDHKSNQFGDVEETANWPAGGAT